MTSKNELVLSRPEAQNSEIAMGLGMLQMARERTLRTVESLHPGSLDVLVNGHTIGSLLYHIAVVEVDWLYSEVLQQELPAWCSAYFPIEHRTSDDNLSHVLGEPLSRHLERLKRVRQDLLDTYQQMTLEDFGTLRKLSHYDVSPEWVLFHLLHHESLHFGQIQTLIRVAGLREGTFRYLTS
ncbi:DinB family protein [Deinococcus roseus]|uniref:DinB-like domain-containing protein n=1 Tax=Deinococcus roseus TaxID=392414 RepID=A0ABQ2D0H5_9DEIO|nr:DinB family protein [Deinococcus roseus]GGJ39250.1 hypothetical protein GCM10008938_26620 [Deinococcus roseus]